MNELPKTSCQGKDCNLKFRYFGTIKPKLCPRCQKLKDFEKSKAKIEANKKILAQSTLYTKNKRTKAKPYKTTTKKPEGQKTIKNASKSKLRRKSNHQRSADAYFSKYIRLKHSFESNGERFCICYTCRSVLKLKVAENGHWQRRGYYSTRFHENNCRPQCHKCNYYNQGAPEIFEQHLIKDIGQDEVNELKKSAMSLGEDNIQFYASISVKYRAKLKALLKELQIDNPWK